MDYSKLKGKIKEVFGTQKSYAEAINMDPSTLTSRLKGTSEWKQKEMALSCKVLGIPFEELDVYFFCFDSLENSTRGI